MTMKHWILAIALCGGLSTLLSAQETRLAQQYYQDGEYEKAAVIYEKLAEANGTSSYFYERYIQSLLALERYAEAETSLKKAIRKEPRNSRLYVSYAQLLERDYRQEEADAMYRKGIDNLSPDRNLIIRMANDFIRLTKYDNAIEVFERGAELLNDPGIFAYSLGDLYRRKGEATPMVKYYLDALQEDPNRENQLKTTFQRYLGEADLKELQSQLYERIQSDQGGYLFPELLAWVFIQRKDYRGALRQVRAIDKRLDENGLRVFQLGHTALNAKDYDAAILAFDYLVDEKGINSPFYLDAKQGALRARRDKLTEGYDYTELELRDLEAGYLEFLSEFGYTPATAGLILELARLEAIYLNDLPQAITLLEDLLETPNVNERVEAASKLALGDYYLMTGDNWEATLLYSQVDKEFKEDMMGHQARFSNARLSYYTGDFQWAQAQFEVLKASTSKLIANDALDLSVFILDNLGLDTTAAALQLYADADLLIFQNRFEEAFGKMDTLLRDFPEHELHDDVLYLKAQIYVKKRQFELAAETYRTIYERYAEGIRADNALFKLAELYENQLGDEAKAMELYETLFIDFSSSTLAVEARKRFRRLRGDKV
jgi:tetratricopeptide (TPR) repeat protein